MQAAWFHGVHTGRGAFNRLIAAHAERGDMVSARRLFTRLKSLYPPLSKNTPSDRRWVPIDVNTGILDIIA